MVWTWLEFIINNIQVHPLALIHYDLLRTVKAKIAMTALYEDKPQYFVEKLAHGVGMIAAAFYPNPVVIRMSDFKQMNMPISWVANSLNRRKKTPCWLAGASLLR